MWRAPSLEKRSFRQSMVSLAGLLTLLSSYSAGSTPSEVDITALSSSSSSFSHPRRTSATKDRGSSSSSDPCRSSSDLPRVCDPDGVLSESERQQVQQAIDDGDGLQIACQGRTIDVQMAVALVQQMDGGSDSTATEDAAPAVAELLARSMHDKWGVGYDGPCGGTGVVLFASVDDRSLYVSRGRALEGVLTDARLNAALEAMRPFLRQAQYGPALVLGVRELHRYVHLGEPGRWERALEHAWVLWVVLGIAFLVWQTRRDRERRQQYAAAASQLSELDRAQAEALHGRFQATSCPICLEPFPVPKDEGGAASKADAAGSQPPARVGSDGKPLKLLRCGHVFDECCWEDWLKSGSDLVDKCPICKAPVGVGRPGERLELPATDGSGGAAGLFRTDDVAATPADNFDARVQLDVNHVVSRYQQERAFRLLRLHRRYPQFIGPRDVQRWSEPRHEGALARDATFVERDPIRIAASGVGSGREPSSGSSSFGSGFGGGTSAGGRGGRW